jgi:hypothetical protein
MKGLKTGGRQKGVKNKHTPEIRALALKIFDAEYWARIKAQAKEGTLHPKIESTLLAYAYGAPQREDANQRGITVNLGFLSLPEAAERPQLTSSQPIELRALPEETEH